jgi:enediyne polyketide synthase
LSGETFGRIVSIVTGEGPAHSTDVPTLLHRQIAEPVLFQPGGRVGGQRGRPARRGRPGRVLAASATDLPAFTLDTDDKSLSGCCGGRSSVHHRAARVNAVTHRRFDRSRRVRSSASSRGPCESAPAVPVSASRLMSAATSAI